MRTASLALQAVRARKAQERYAADGSVTSALGADHTGSGDTSHSDGSEHGAVSVAPSAPVNASDRRPRGGHLAAGGEPATTVASPWVMSPMQLLQEPEAGGSDVESHAQSSSSSRATHTATQLSCAVDERSASVAENSAPYLACNVTTNVIAANERALSPACSPVQLTSGAKDDMTEAPPRLPAVDDGAASASKSDEAAKLEATTSARSPGALSSPDKGNLTDLWSVTVPVPELAPTAADSYIDERVITVGALSSEQRQPGTARRSLVETAVAPTTPARLFEQRSARSTPRPSARQLLDHRTATDGYATDGSPSDRQVDAMPFDCHEPLPRSCRAMPSPLVAPTFRTGPLLHQDNLRRLDAAVSPTDSVASFRSEREGSPPPMQHSSGAAMTASIPQKLPGTARTVESHESLAARRTLVPHLSPLRLTARVSQPEVRDLTSLVSTPRSRPVARTSPPGQQPQSARPDNSFSVASYSAADAVSTPRERGSRVPTPRQQMLPTVRSIVSPQVIPDTRAGLSTARMESARASSEEPAKGQQRDRLVSWRLLSGVAAAPPSVLNGSGALLIAPADVVRSVPRSPSPSTFEASTPQLSSDTAALPLRSLRSAASAGLLRAPLGSTALSRGTAAARPIPRARPFAAEYSALVAGRGSGGTLDPSLATDGAHPLPWHPKSDAAVLQQLAAAWGMNPTGAVPFASRPIADSHPVMVTDEGSVRAEVALPTHAPQHSLTGRQSASASGTRVRTLATGLSSAQRWQMAHGHLLGARPAAAWPTPESGGGAGGGWIDAGEETTASAARPTFVHLDPSPARPATVAGLGVARRGLGRVPLRSLIHEPPRTEQDSAAAVLAQTASFEHASGDGPSSPDPY